MLIYVFEKHVIFLFFRKLFRMLIYSFRETWTTIFLLVKPVLSMELVVCWFLLVKPNFFWCFSSWNLLYVDLFFRKTLFLMKIFSWNLLQIVFFLGTRCLPIFVHENCCMSIISSRNLTDLDLCFQETWYILFLIHVTCCLLVFLFVKHVLWFFFSLHETGSVRGNCCM